MALARFNEVDTALEGIIRKLEQHSNRAYVGLGVVQYQKPPFVVIKIWSSLPICAIVDRFLKWFLG